jgi:hypothetical protein
MALARLQRRVSGRGLAAVLLVLAIASLLSCSGAGRPNAGSAAAVAGGAAPGWDGATCRESPVTQATGPGVVERDGGALLARMPQLVAGHESKVL